MVINFFFFKFLLYNEFSSFDNVQLFHSYFLYFLKLHLILFKKLNFINHFCSDFDNYI